MRLGFAARGFASAFLWFSAKASAVLPALEVLALIDLSESFLSWALKLCGSVLVALGVSDEFFIQKYS